MRKQISADAKTLAWMQAANAKIKKLNANNTATKQITSPVVLLSLLQKQVEQSGLQQAMTGLKQSGNDAIEMQFQSVEFDKLMRFLVATITKERVIITQFQAISTDKPGVVNVNLQIST